MADASRVLQNMLAADADPDIKFCLMRVERLAIEAAIRAIQSQQDGAQGGEAVAWRYRYYDSGGWTYQQERPSDPPKDNPDGKIMEPLYASPAPAQQAVTDGLIDGEELLRLIGGVGGWTNLDGDKLVKQSSVLELIRRRVTESRNTTAQGDSDA